VPRVATRRSVSLSFDGRAVSELSAAKLLEVFTHYLSHPDDLLLVSSPAPSGSGAAAAR